MEPPIFSRSPLAVRLALACLLLAGVLIRLPHLADAPLEFHPTRQYRSAVMARGYAIEYLTGYSEQERHAARTMAAQMGPIEPPIFERTAALLYRVAGREALWMPRLLGVLAWTGGAVAMWWLTAPVFGSLAGLTAVAVFLFLPFGVPASQAFQPDSLMTALIVAAWAASLRRHRHPSMRAALVLTLFAAAAVFIKPMAAFFVVPVELALSTSRDGWLRGLRRSAAWAVVVAVPAAAWYLYVATTAPSVFDDRFFPQLLTRAVFWSDWFRMVARVITWPVLALALFGVLVARGAGSMTQPDSTRRALVAVGMGYLAFGLLFTHHIHTHDYYSLPLIPMTGWSIGALVWSARDRVRLDQSPRPGIVTGWRPGLQPRLTAGLKTRPPSGRLRITIFYLRGQRYVPHVVLLLAATSVGVAWHGRPYAPDPATAAEMDRYERIGRVVGHSARVISLDGHYGFPLGYHGRLVASNLPLSIDAAVSALTGRSGPPLETLVASIQAEFFVATSQPEFDAQPGLRAFLDQRYAVVDRDGTPERWHFVVYDLRHTRMSLSPDRLSAFVRAGGAAAPEASTRLWTDAGTRWRTVVSSPALLDVTPTEGVGPATLTIVPRASADGVYQFVDVAIYGEGQQNASATITVRVGTVPAGPPTPPFGFVDSPAEPVVAGRESIVFQGWALDDVSMRRVWVAVRDGAGAEVALGDAAWVGMRPDVAAAHPNAHDIYRSAWAWTLDPEAIRGHPQPVTLVFYAEDGDGLRAALGRRTVTVRQ